MLTFTPTTRGDTGYYLPYSGAARRIEDGVDTGAITFERMAEDCAVQGCWIERHESVGGGRVIFRHRTASWMPGEPSLQAMTDDPTLLVRVDIWRRSLHEEPNETIADQRRMA